MVAGDRAVELLRERLAAGGRGGVAAGDLLGALGGFAAAIPLPAGYREPVLVSATDGVGTKTEIARRLGRRDTIGQDLVAMCADDVACHGAQPLFFLDYLAVGRVDPPVVAEIVGGIAAGCCMAGCALVGGETAEHPGLMESDAFDLAGFCLGVVERSQLLDGTASEPGDAVIGLAATGLHANGYSLARAVLARESIALDSSFQVLARRVAGPEVGDRVAPDATVGDALLEPTTIYAQSVLGLRAYLEAAGAAGAALRGASHITGGGLPANLPRAVRSDLAVEIDATTWPEDPVSLVFGRLAGMSGTERRATFNAGIGMGLVVGAENAPRAMAWLAAAGIANWRIGRVVESGARDTGRYRELGEG